MEMRSGQSDETMALVLLVLPMTEGCHNRQGEKE